MKVIKGFKYCEQDNGNKVLAVNVGDTDLSDHAIKVGKAMGCIETAKAPKQEKMKDSKGHPADWNRIVQTTSQVLEFAQPAQMFWSAGPLIQRVLVLQPMHKP